ncbi:hypothetical protein CORC01_05701 [Colletotrichum orchidophilum]|uniref:Uncharacterized protein n=1 Tax=Colletotrichum orchidophilum TaxID=1209926 RepID=A0A1G4BC96_9PEZI|nr:uncharacterized protein CORC01_05701 [Colletotrichum orchidophilum]OHE99011.1 hypothetical protein CORC01_05701 [Colletotrichum orchidophilum]
MPRVLSSSNPGPLMSINHLIRSSNLIPSTPPFGKRMHCTPLRPSKMRRRREDDHLEGAIQNTPPPLADEEKLRKRGIFCLFTCTLR